MSVYLNSIFLSRTTAVSVVTFFVPFPLECHFFILRYLLVEDPGCRSRYTIYKIECMLWKDRKSRTWKRSRSCCFLATSLQKMKLSRKGICCSIGQREITHHSNQRALYNSDQYNQTEVFLLHGS